ncbi:hypothetical protein F5148DRAFT_1206695 [Russula earlei]|uniref:Uncharacterized protein n=1 Tax=Russula earlei TaxID=71964 RepID=A0ACC0U703_9AGAM|nr:hypothetical protein F5148DRAFT_1206695 [Russula earlei]
MRPESVLTPTPLHLSTGRKNTDEQWKVDLRKRIEDDLGVRHMTEQAQRERDATLSSQPSESSHKRAQLEYEGKMHIIQSLVQEKFERELPREMFERRSALDDVVGPNSPDVVLQRGESERGSDESTEGRYVNAWLDDEGSGSDESGGKEALREYLNQILESTSPVPRRNAASRQRQPSDSQLAQDYDNEDPVDSHESPVRRHGSQPFSPGEGSHHQSLSAHTRSIPRPQVFPSISRAFAHTSEQTYATSPVKREGSASSIGSISSGASHSRAGSLNSDQHRSRGVALHGNTEHLPGQNRVRIASNIGPRERQTSASASPHSPIQFTRRDSSISSTGSTGSGAGLHRGRTVKPDQYRWVAANSNAERLLSQNRISSIISPRARSPSPIPLTRPSSISSIGSTNSGAGLRVGSLNSDQYRSRRVASHNDTERSPTQNHSRDVMGNIFRDVSQLSSDTHGYLDDFIARKRHKSKDVSRLISADGDLSDASDNVVGDLDDRRSMHSVRSSLRRHSMRIEQRAMSEAEAQRKEEEASPKEEEARQYWEEPQRVGSSVHLEMVSHKMREAAAQKKEAEAMRKIAEAKKRDAEAQIREAEAQTREAEARMREVAVLTRETEAQRKEEEACLREGEARRLEEKARRSLEGAERLAAGIRQAEASAKMHYAAAQRREAEVKRTEAEAKKREAEAQTREAEAQAQVAEALERETETQRKEEELRRREDEARRLEEKLQQALEAERVEDLEEKIRKMEGYIQDLEGKLRTMEGYVQNREAEIEEICLDTKKRSQALNLQEDDLRQKWAAFREQEEKLELREAALERMEIERHRGSVDGGDDLFSLTSRIDNTSPSSSNYATSSKDDERLKDSENYGNQG